MVKKSDLRSEFERIVRTVKMVSVGHKKFPVVDFQIEIIPLGFSYVIQLVGYAEYPLGHEVLSQSYPLSSYKSAYQTVVRL